MATRSALHAVAEQVMAGARYRAEGRIGLHVTARGFATPPFGSVGRILAIDDVWFTVTDAGETRRHPLATTLDALAAAAGTTPGAPDSYPAETSIAPDESLVIDEAMLRRLTAWQALGNEALRTVATQLGAAEVLPPTLWPEHFDVAVRVGALNLGASLGDSSIASPYLYVGPDARPLPDDGFWNAPFGAARTWESIGTVDDAVAFFREGEARASALSEG